MGATREYLQVTPEVTPGSFNGSGTAVLIDLDSANAYTMRPQPIRQTIRTAGALNRRLKTISKKTQFVGNLNFTVRGSYAALLSAWCQPTSGVLASYTVDHVLVGEDSGSTHIYSRILGVYIQQAQISASEQDQWMKAQLQLVGMAKATITSSDFAEPAVTAYPTDPFLTFEDGSGGLTLHSATRLDIETFTVTIKNMLDTRFYVAATPQKIKWCGRDVDWTSRLSLASSIPRTDYEAQTGVAGAITFNNGTNSLAFAMEGQNYYSGVTDQLDQSKVYLQEVTLESHLDTSVPNDFAMVAT
jgi:Phage tail tube protein